MASRSLGTLTLDLVAKIGGFTEGLSKAERHSEKWRRKMQKDAKMVAKSMLAVGTAVAAGTAALVISTTNAARELKNLSGIANTSTQSLQKLSYAAGAYGVEQGKIADILKDTSDKVGDFLQSGGGPLVDFFENIAPLVGVTAEQFRELSGDQALQLYVDSLEKANLSQSEMVFYMEAIASDATALLPLLRNNGAELKTLGDRAERMGIIFSELELEQALNVDKKIRLLGQEFQAVGRKIAIDLLPHVEEFLEIVTDPEVIAAVQKLAGAIVDSFGTAAKVLSGVVDFVTYLSEEAAIISVGINPTDIVRLEMEAKRLRGLLTGEGGIADRMVFFGADGQTFNWLTDGEIYDELVRINAQIDKFYAKRNEVPPIAEDLPSGKPGKGRPRAGFSNTQAREAFKALVESLKTEEEAIFESYDKRRDIILKNTRANSEARTTLLKRLSDEQMKALEASQAIQIQRSLESEEEAIRRSYEERARIIQESALFTEQGKAETIAQLNEKLSDELRATAAGQLAEQLLSEEAAIAASYERRRKIILDSTQFTAQETTDLLTALEKERDENLRNTAFGRLSEALQTEEESIQASFERRQQIILDNTTATEEARTELLMRLEEDRQKQLAELEMKRLENAELLFGSLAEIAKTYAGEQSGIYKALFAVEKAAAVARAIVAIQTGIAQAAAQPFPANLAAIASVASATAGIVSTIIGTEIQGVAHDGLDSVPKTGTYLLEKGERVTTEKTSAKLDRKLERMDGGTQPDVNVKLNNIIDPAFVGDYMGSDQGDAIIDNWVTRNQTKIQRVAGGGR